MVKKIFVAKTSRGTYYVQRMPDVTGYGDRYVLFKDRRQVYYMDFRYESAAISAMLELLSRELFKQGSLDLF